MDYYFPINEKIRLLALKTILAARLYEERIILIESEKLEYPKTKFLHEIVSPYKQDKLLFLTGFEPDQNFVQASQNIQNVDFLNAHQLNVLPIVNHDWVFATVEGLQDLEMIIENRSDNLFRNKKIPRERLPYDEIIKNSVRRTEKKRDRFEEDIIKAILEREETEADQKPLELVTESLKGYIRDIKDMQNPLSSGNQEASRL